MRGNWHDQMNMSLSGIAALLEGRGIGPGVAISTANEIMGPAFGVCEVFLEVLLELKRGDCWCEVGIGNPMMTEHSATCEKVQLIFSAEDRGGFNE